MWKYERTMVNPPRNKDFESCNNCIHADDTREICVLRLCIHAIGHLSECYEPKSGKESE